MKIIQFLIITILLNLTIQAASMRESVMVNLSGGAICKNYAEEVGGNVEIFSEMNVEMLLFAERMGYTNDMHSFQSQIYQGQQYFQNALLEKYGSKLNIYNDWCIRLYNGYQKGKARGSR